MPYMTISDHDQDLISDARNMTSTMATTLAKIVHINIAQVDARTLSEIKRELSYFNSHTGTWNPKP